MLVVQREGEQRKKMAAFSIHLSSHTRFFMKRMSSSGAFYGRAAGPNDHAASAVERDVEEGG